MKLKPMHLSTAPMAVASDGSVLVNATTWTTEDDIDAVVQAARAHGGTVFVGVALSPTEVRQALHMADDMAAEIAGRVGARGRR